MFGSFTLATFVSFSLLAGLSLASPAPQPVGDAIATPVPEGTQKTCMMTSKPGQDCNIETCRQGGEGGYCYVDSAGRCRIQHNDIIECKIKCRCIAA